MTEQYEVTLDGHYKAIGNLHDFIERIYNNPTMTRDEKREFVDIAYFQMIDIARSGNDLIKEIKKISEEAKESAKKQAAPISREIQKPKSAAGQIPAFQ